MRSVLVAGLLVMTLLAPTGSAATFTNVSLSQTDFAILNETGVRGQGSTTLSVSLDDTVSAVTWTLVPTCTISRVCLPVQVPMQGAGTSWSATINGNTTGILASTYTSFLQGFGGGNPFAQGPNVTVTAGPDTTRPVVNVGNIVDGLRVASEGDSVDIGIEEPFLAAVVLARDGGPKVRLQEPYRLIANNFPEGDTQVVIDAYDQALNLGRLTFTLRVDRAAPTIELDVPEVALAGIPFDVKVLVQDGSLTNVTVNLTGFEQVRSNQSLNQTPASEALLGTTYQVIGDAERTFRVTQDFVGEARLRVTAIDAFGRLTQADGVWNVTERAFTVELRDIAFKPDRITSERNEISVQVRAPGWNVTEQIELDLFIRGERVETRTVTIPAGGETVVVFEPFLPQGTILAKVEARATSDAQNLTANDALLSMRVPIGRVVVGDEAYLIYAERGLSPRTAQGEGQTFQLEERQFEGRVAYFFTVDGREVYWDPLNQVTVFEAEDAEEEKEASFPALVALVALLGAAFVARRKD